MRIICFLQLVLFLLLLPIFSLCFLPLKDFGEVRTFFQWGSEEGRRRFFGSPSFSKSNIFPSYCLLFFFFFFQRPSPTLLFTRLGMVAGVLMLCILFSREQGKQNQQYSQHMMFLPQATLPFKSIILLECSAFLPLLKMVLERTIGFQPFLFRKKYTAKSYIGQSLGSSFILEWYVSLFPFTSRHLPIQATTQKSDFKQLQAEILPWVQSL